MSMDKDTFWRIIDKVNSEVPRTDLDGIVEATRLMLCYDYAPQEIALWSNYQAYYKDLADTSGLFAASCCLNDYMSDDGFNDFRMWLISQGKEVYLAALKNPDSLARLDVPVSTTRFEPYGYVAYAAYDAWDMHGDVYEEKERNPLTEAQKAEIRAEIEYYPHRITDQNAASHLPKLHKKYLNPGETLSFRYEPWYPPPSNARESVTGLERLKDAARLIEEMTGCRFKHNSGGAFLYPESSSDAYLAINMRKESDYGANLYRVRFDANLQTMGKPMDAAGLMRLQQEAGVAHTLLSALEIEEYNLTLEEMSEFNEYIRQREEPEQMSGMKMN